MPQFLKLSSGAVVNLAHVVLLTPPGHLQVTSGNVLILTAEDAAAVEQSLLPPEPDWTAITKPGRLWLPTSPVPAAELPPPPELSETVVLRDFGRVGTLSKIADEAPPPPEEPKTVR
jgi:hypothetical protein